MPLAMLLNDEGEATFGFFTIGGVEDRLEIRADVLRMATLSTSAMAFWVKWSWQRCHATPGNSASRAAR